MRGVDRYTVGEVEVLCLTDGETVFGPEVFPALDTATCDARLERAGLDGIASEFNAYVLRHAGGIDLVDTGCGTQFGPKAGRLAALLAELEIAPGDIARIIHTHLHRDHVGGSFDGNRLVFPQAQVLMHRLEAVQWRDTDGPGAQVIDRANRLSLFEDGADLGHGITLWHLPGHTNGHCGLKIGNLRLVGDIVHSEALQLPDPSLSPMYDTDGAQAAETRRNALAEIARDGLVWSGSHMLGPQKFARLTAVGDGFERGAL
ncbi:MBL fold metallo-hydrolase [Tropicibacter alexandrii]|uniref:MBL fold metallo-hydrolase n=1 Tax=Tropicibacter alexandrii TaxID=2267683 RepID=UPI000EF4449A|nr:MBL fold metallo-hydrolase [Tropicibacter alexandrii]